MPRKPAMPGVDRRQQLLEAALSIFAEKGFEAATTKEITEQIGVHQGLLYFYFESKAALFFAVFRYYGQLVQAQLDTIFEQEPDEDPATDLQRLLRQIMTVLNTPTAINLLHMLHQIANSRTPGELPHMLHQVAGSRIPGDFPHGQAEQRPPGPVVPHLIHRLTAYLDSQVARGKLQPVKTDFAAAMITRTLISPFVKRSHGNPARAQPSPQEQAEMIATLFCYGLLPRERQPDTP